MLDIKQLLKLDTNINYFSHCPACGMQVSDHKDTDFLRDQIAEIAATDDDAVVEVNDDVTIQQEEDVQLPRKKKTKLPVTATEAVVLIKKVCISFFCFSRLLLNVFNIIVVVNITL